MKLSPTTRKAISNTAHLLAPGAMLVLKVGTSAFQAASSAYRDIRGHEPGTQPQVEAQTQEQTAGKKAA